MVEFPVDEVLARCLKVIAPLAEQKGLAIAADLTARAIVQSDRAIVQQIVTNLLANAIRYTHRGQITIRSRVIARGLCIEVEDSGIGIAPRDVPHVFDDYFRAHPTEDGGAGFGLGLALARRMASLVGGALSVESEVGRGSTFTLLLPPGVIVALSNSSQPPGEHPMSPAVANKTVRCQVVVQNEGGMHLRAASCFAQLARQYRADVRVRRNGQTVDGKSILDLVTLAAECGSTLDIEAVGSDAAEVVGELAKFLESGLRDT
jgi:phosphotransferase system HPr (HPr) family protein